MNPPGHADLALDFLAVDERKSPYKDASLWRHIFGTLPVTATYAWNMPDAPLDGVVIAACDGMVDRERISLLRDLFRLLVCKPASGAPFSAYGGNYVILKCGEAYPLFAHLRRGSVCVRVGDAVRAGDRLGTVGNSGNSLQPHLHFQVMSDPNPFPLFRNLVPFVLSSFRRYGAREFATCTNTALKNGNHVHL